MPYKSRQKQKEASRAHYLKNKKEYARRYKERRRDKIIWIQGLKELKPCADCKIKYPYLCMQYHHVNGKKRASISKLLRENRSRKIIEAEIKKCVLLCANCHALRHGP